MPNMKEIVKFILQEKRFYSFKNGKYLDPSHFFDNTSFGS